MAKKKKKIIGSVGLDGSITSYDNTINNKNIVANIGLDGSVTDIAPVRKTTGTITSSLNSLSKDELLEKRKDLQKQLTGYDRKEKREWWDKDDNVLENVGNVLYKAFAEKQDSKYVEDKTYNSLAKQLEEVEKLIEDKTVAEHKYSDGLMGFIEKSNDTIVSNFTTGTKGITTTAKKILGQEITEEDYGLNLAERLGQKASTSASNSLEKVLLDVEGGVARMIPQMAMGNPTGATIMGFANYGGGAYNEARQDGYTDEQATKYGITIGSLEMAMTKALGSFGEIYGSSKLGKASQSVIDKFIPKIISNKQVRQVLSQFGSEGIEEFLQEYTGKIVKDTLLDEKGLLNSTWENITDTDLLADALYSGFIGGITGAALDVPNAIARNNYEKTTGRNADTGYTQNEQSIVDKVIEERVAEAEKEGTKLTKKQKGQIEKQVKEDLAKGYISTDTIESVLGGEEYNAYKSVLDKQNRYNELLDKKSGETSNRERVELEALKEELDGIDINTLKSNLDSSMANKIAKDDYLQRSYQERAKKGQLYEQTETSDNEKINSWQQSFVDAKSNNTSKAHDFSEFGNKIIQDKNISMRAVNYDTLVEEGKMRKREVDNTTIYEMNVNGKWKEVAINGYKENGVLNINLQSNRAFETTVGHELGEFIKDSDSTMYEELKNIAIELGKADGTYNEAALNKYADLYGENTDNVVDEYVNDKLGELFTNEKFVEQLSTKPSIIKKIINEIKHLVKMATADSNEQRKLLSLQHKLENKFKETYEKTDLTKENAIQTESNTKYSIQQKEDGSKYVNVDTDQDIFYGIAKKDYNKIAKMYINDYLKGDTLLSNSDIAIIDSKSANKYTNPGKKQPNFVEKMKLTPELKNVLAISEKIDVSSPTKDNSKYSNWEYYQFDFKINDKTFSGLVNIGIDKNGNKHFYEVNNIHNLDIQKRTSGISETSPNRPTSSLFNNISQNKTDVKFSLTDTQTLGEGNNQYVAFYPEQIKNVTNENPTDNPDINLSLSQQGEQIAPKNPNLTYGEDVKLQIAPLKEEIKTLTETVQELKEQIAPVKSEQLDTAMNSRALTEEDLPMLERQYNEVPMNDIAPPEIEQTIDYMPDAISMDSKTLKILTRNVKNELGLNRVQTAELEKVVQEFTTNETATREDLFNAISERFSEQTLEHKNEEIIAIKNFLRNYPIKVSNYLKTEFKEGFNKIRQSNFNKLKFTNDGTEVDAAYQELSSMFPSLFPDDIANAQDQLSKIIEVANLDVMSTEEFVLPEEMVRETSDFIYDSIQDYKLDEVFKAAEQVRRLPIDENMIPVEIVGNSVENKDIAPVKAQATESVEENKNLTIKDSNALKLKNLESTLEKYRVDAENSFNSFKELISEKNREYDALANKNTLKANNLLQQVRRLVAQRDNIQVEYERKMNNIQKRIDRMNSKEFKTAEQRMSKQEEYREQARTLIGDTSFWKDKKLGIQYQINTFKRNLRDIVKGADGKADIQTADAIYEEYQGNYNRNEAKLKVESNKIKQPYMDMKLTKQEDAYVQMLGELKYNPDTTLRQDVVEGYYEKNKNKIDINKVNKAIEMARKTYDSLYDRINEVLRNQGMKELGYRQGYFPHFTEEKQSMLAKLFDWKVKNNEIPTDIAGLTELNNPERSWQSFNKQRKGDTTDYSFSKGLDTYVHGALDWIYHIEDIQKRRALENEIRYQHSEKGVQEKIEAIYNNPELDADEVQTQIEAIYGVAKNPLNNFVTDLRNSTNNLTGKKSSADRGLEYATNRQIYSIMTNISSRVSGNMVGGSISSALTNFIPITQSWGEVSPLSSLNAIRETIKSSIKDDGTIAKSTFLTNRLVKEEKLSKTNWDKASDVVGVMTEVIDNITSQTVWRSKYNENIKKGMSEFNAIKNADQFAENVIAGRSRGNQPTIFNSKNPITKMLTAFQLEVANQYGYMLKDMPTDISEKSKGKLIKGYASMFMGAYLYNALYSSLTGRDSAFDPIGIVEDILKEFGFGDDDEEEKSASEKLTSITEDLVQEIPFIGGLFGGGRLPISSAIPYENPFEMATGTMTDILDAFDEEKKEKALKDLTSEWLKPVTYLALPFGGGQISKSIKGLSMYDEDLPIAGSYTNGGDLRFTADESLGGKLKSFLFGQYASKSAQEYVDSGFKTIKKSNIEELMDLGMTSTEYRKYRQELKNAGNTNKSKLDYINGLDAPISHKNIMANNVLDRDYKVDMRDYTTYDEFDFSYKNPEKYEWLQKNNISYSDYIANDESKEAYNWAYSNPESYLVSRTVADDVVAYRQYKSEIENLKADYNSNGKQIKDSRRNKVIDYVSSLNLSVPQRAILIRQEYLTFNDYNNEIVEYVRNLNISYDEKVSILEELDMTVKDGRVYWK